MLEYRAELFLWALSGSLPLILMGVWTKAAQGGQFGLSPLDFTRYFLAVFIVRQFTVVWVIWEFEKEVIEGRTFSSTTTTARSGSGIMWHLMWLNVLPVCRSVGTDRFIFLALSPSVFGSKFG
jgi:hypothetical protein